LGVVDKIREEPQCKACIILQEMLQREIADKNYYRNLALKAAGVIKEENDEFEQVRSWTPIRRIVTLSQARRAAELATRKEKTEEETLFEEKLNEAKEKAAI